MFVEQHIITFAASAQQFPAANNGIAVTRMLAEPLRSNTHASFIGNSAVTNDGSGTGVFKQIAQPPAATVPVDYFEHYEMDGRNTIDPTQFYGHGTTGEKLLLTYFQR